MFIDYIKKIETKTQEIVSDITTESLIAYLKWFPEKLTIQFQTTTPQKFFPSRGEIYYIRLGNNVGSEINKERPCVVLSKQSFNAGDTIIVVPIKGNYKKANISSYSIFIKPNTLNNL